MAASSAMGLRQPGRGMRAFLLIWAGQLISILGSQLTGFALGVWVYQTTGSVTQLTLISFFASIPFLAVTPLAGALVDRWNLRWTMLLGDLGGAFATLAYLALLASGLLQIWHIYIIVAITAVFGAFQFPALSVATTLIVPKEQLGRASGLNPLAQGIAQLLGPLLAGVLVALVGLPGVIAIDFASCLFAIATLLAVRIPARAAPAAGAQPPALGHDMLFGWRYILARPGLLSLLVLFAVSNFMTATVVTLAKPLILAFTTPAVLGLILSVAGLGVLAGGLAMSIWGGPRRRVDGVLASFALSGVCLLAGGLAPSAWLIGAAAFLFSIGTPIIAGCSQAIWQVKVPAEVQGRVFATRSLIAMSSLPLAFLLTGPLADYVFEPALAPGGALAGSVGRLIGVGPGRGIALLFMAFGALMLLLVLAGALYPRLRNVEDDLPDARPEPARAVSAMPGAPEP